MMWGDHTVSHRVAGSDLVEGIRECALGAVCKRGLEVRNGLEVHLSCSAFYLPTACSIV